MSKFAIAEVMPGHLNAVVKNIMRQSGIKDPNEAVRAFNAGDLILTPRDPQPLLRPVGDPALFSAVPRFVAREAFTAANGNLRLEGNFIPYILSMVEENVPGEKIWVHELTRNARGFRVAAELNIDRGGDLFLAHFFQAIQRGLHPCFTAYVMGSHDVTWALSAKMLPRGWRVGAKRLGEGDSQSAGDLFLSC